MANIVGVERSVPQILTRFERIVLSSFSIFLKIEIRYNFLILLKVLMDTLTSSQHVPEQHHECLQ